MKLLSQLSLAVFCSAAPAVALECAVEIAMAGNTKTVDLQLEPAEHPFRSLLLLPNNRAAAGTAISPPNDTIITGGRLVVANIDTATIEAAMETPTVEGQPTMMGEVTRSADGRYILATGGYLFGGPALLYEADPEFQFRGAHRMTRNPLAMAVNGYITAIEAAKEGDSQAKLSLMAFDPDGSLRNLYEADPTAFRTELSSILSEQWGLSEEGELVPVMGVQFHPSRRAFLLNSGEAVSIRSSTDGHELHRILLSSRKMPRSMDPPRAYFLGAGDQVVSLSRQFLALWDVETGRLLDWRKHSADLSEFEPVVSSPGSEYFSYVVERDEGPVREVWEARTSADEQGKTLTRVAQYSSPPKKGAPTVAFSGKGVYAVGRPGGVVEIYDMKTHQLVANSQIRMGASEERGELYVPDVAMDFSGKWLVASARSSRGDFLELWSVDKRQGVRMRVPSPTVPGRRSYISEVEFDPEGGWFSFVRHESEKIPPQPGVRYVGGPEDRYGPVAATPYVVDVYSTIAKAVKGN